MAYNMIFEVVKIDPDFIMDFLSSLCYDSVFGVAPYLEDSEYDEIRDSIKDRPEFVYNTLCVDDVYMEALRQDKLLVRDTDNEKDYKLTMDMLKKGLELYLSLPFTNKDFENMDAIDHANLLQCAVFGEIIYG